MAEVMDSDYLFERSQEDDERRKILLVKNDELMQRLILMWPYVNKEHGLMETFDECVFSYDEWCALAGLPPSPSNLQKCQTIINLGLVLPDGRFHYWVGLYMDDCASRIVARPREE